MRCSEQIQGNFYRCLQRNSLLRVILRNEVTKNLEASTFMYTDSSLTIRMTWFYIVFIPLILVRADEVCINKKSNISFRSQSFYTNASFSDFYFIVLQSLPIRCSINRANVMKTRHIFKKDVYSVLSQALRSFTNSHQGYGQVTKFRFPRRFFLYG